MFLFLINSILNQIDKGHRSVIDSHFNQLDFVKLINIIHIKYTIKSTSLFQISEMMLSIFLSGNLRKVLSGNLRKHVHLRIDFDKNLYEY